MRDREGQCLHKIRLSKGTEGKNSRYIGRIRGGQNSLSYFPALISIALLFAGFAQICFLVNSLITSLELSIVTCSASLIKASLEMFTVADVTTAETNNNNRDHIVFKNTC